MTAITTHRPLTVRLASGALAVMLSLGIFAVVSESLHMERMGHGAPLVQLEPVTVTAQRVAIDAATFAATSSQTRAN